MLQAKNQARIFCWKIMTDRPTINGRTGRKILKLHFKQVKKTKTSQWYPHGNNPDQDLSWLMPTCICTYKFDFQESTFSKNKKTKSTLARKK